MDTLPNLSRDVPIRLDESHSRYSDCIQACLACEVACTGASESLLSGSGLEALQTTISLALDCADVCSTTARLLGRMRDADGEVLRALLEACARSCATCGADCLRLAALEPACKAAAQACRRCETECDIAIRKLRHRRTP
jgi:hypothetical protein